MNEQVKVPVSRIILESAFSGQSAVVGSLADADAVLAAWSQARDVDRGTTDGSTTVYCVVSWADGSRLVASYDLVFSRDAAPDLGAAIRFQCEYSAGLRRPSTMTAAEYEAFIAGAGQATVERYKKMIASLDM